MYQQKVESPFMIKKDSLVLNPHQCSHRVHSPPIKIKQNLQRTQEHYWDWEWDWDGDGAALDWYGFRQ